MAWLKYVTLGMGGVGFSSFGRKEKVFTSSPEYKLKPQVEHDCYQETILKRRDGEISFIMQGKHFNLAFITRAILLEKVAMLIYAKYVRFIPCFMFQLSLQ